MTDAPEQIWAWDFIDSRQEEGIIRGGWDDSFDRKATQYTRTDIAQKAGWQPIKTAPEGERVLVAGYQPRSGNVAGYWWWHEDVVFEGDASAHERATHWCAILRPSSFPDAPTTRTAMGGE